MKHLSLAFFGVAVVAQLTVPASMIWNHGRTLQQGTVWKFRTRPVDPVDAFRGRYVTLEFEAEEILAGPDNEVVFGDAWVSLRTAPDGFAEVERVSGTKLKGDNVMKVTAQYRSANGRQLLEFPFDHYWMEETLAPQAELAYRALNQQERRDSYVTVRIRNGQAVLEELFLQGKPVREYLHDQAR